MSPTIEEVLYTGKAHTKGGRNGESRSSDGRLDIKLWSPGATGGVTSAEQLFAAGWSACFLGAMGVAAARLRSRLRRTRPSMPKWICATQAASTSCELA